MPCGVFYRLFLPFTTATIPFTTDFHHLLSGVIGCGHHIQNTPAGVNPYTQMHPKGKNNSTVQALKGISLNFRETELVSVLGPSGCGKTTLLNMIGGLDRYTTGGMEINGTSIEAYQDKDWDTYRNHSVGFVFQNYNRIPHQTILDEVVHVSTIATLEPTTAIGLVALSVVILLIAGTIPAKMAAKKDPIVALRPNKQH